MRRGRRSRSRGPTSTRAKAPPGRRQDTGDARARRARADAPPRASGWNSRAAGRRQTGAGHLSRPLSALTPGGRARTPRRWQTALPARLPAHEALTRADPPPAPAARPACQPTRRQRTAIAHSPPYPADGARPPAGRRRYRRSVRSRGAPRVSQLGDVSEFFLAGHLCPRPDPAGPAPRASARDSALDRERAGRLRGWPGPGVPNSRA